MIDGVLLWHNYDNVYLDAWKRKMLITFLLNYMMVWEVDISTERPPHIKI